MNNIDLLLSNNVKEFDKINRIGESHIMSSVSIQWEIEEKYFYPNVVLKNIPSTPVLRRNLIGLRLYKKPSEEKNLKRDRFVQSYSYKERGSKYIQKPFRQIMITTKDFNEGVSCTPLEALNLVKEIYSGITITNSVYNKLKNELILNIEYGELKEEINEFTQSYLIEDNLCCIDENNNLQIYKRYFISSKEYKNPDVEFVDSYPNNLYFTTGDVYIAGNNYLVYPVLVSNNKNQILINSNHVYRTVCEDSIDILEDMLDDTENYPSSFSISESDCLKAGVKGDEFKNKRTFLIIKKTFLCGGVYSDENFSYVSYYSLLDITVDYYLANDFWNIYNIDYSGDIKKYYNADGTITTSGGLYKQEPIKALYQTTKSNAQTYMIPFCWLLLHTQSQMLCFRRYNHHDLSLKCYQPYRFFACAYHQASILLQG